MGPFADKNKRHINVEKSAESKDNITSPALRLWKSVQHLRVINNLMLPPNLIAFAMFHARGLFAANGSIVRCFVTMN